MALISRSFAGRVDTFHGGPYSTAPGTTKRTGVPTNTPTRARVVLHDQQTFTPIREVWSDPQTGAYQFKNLRAGTFYVVSFDHTGQYNGEVVTGVTVPEPTP